MRRRIACLRDSGNLAWSIAAAFISLIAIAPVLAIIVLAAHSGDSWPHLIANVLPGAMRRTLSLMAGVGVLTLLIGTGTARFVTMCRFAGRSLFQWPLLLPLAIPTYIIAYCYLELFDYSGALQTALRDIFGWQSAKDYWFPDLRTVGGAIFVMSIGAPSLRLHHRAGELPCAIGVRGRNEPHARPDRRSNLPRGCLAAREASACRWRCARPDGDAERFWRGRILRRTYAHCRRLRHLARPQQPG